MPVQDEKKKSKDAKALKEKLDVEAKAKNSTAICRLIQEDLEIGGTATYHTSPFEEERVIKVSSKENYLVFIIGGSFTIGSFTKVYKGNGVGHFVNNESVIALKPRSVVVLISGYSNTG